MRYFIPVLLLFFASVSFAQTGIAPTPDTSLSAYQPGTRPLPPSIVAELRRSQKNRTLIYRDTLHADDLEKEHFNDSVVQNYTDSAISVIDTAVSLPHKEWLDSELIEIPELTRFGSHVHFNYPASMTMETDLHAVPFDSSFIESMNPVTREHLPFFDQSPISQPLRTAQPSESFLEAGIGNVVLPRADGWLAQSLSERSALTVWGDYESFEAAQTAIHQNANLLATLSSQFGEDPSEAAFHSQELTVQGGYDAKTVAITNLTTADHTLSDFFGSADVAGDVSESFHYHASIGDHDWNDNLNAGVNESSQDASLVARFDFDPMRLLIEGNYSRAAISGDSSAPDANFFGSIVTPISAESAKALVGERDNGAFEWYAGAEYLRGNGVDGSTYSDLLPVLRARLQLNARWEWGANFEPQVQLASARVLSGINPFYAPGIVLQFRESDPTFQATEDARSVVMDKINLASYMNYMLSPDDELRIEARYITRDREPIFSAVTAKDSATVFTVTPESTQHFELTAAANFLLFTHDVLTGSAEFCSATLDSGGTIPYAPTAKIMAEYHFNSIWDNVQPSVAFNSISRPGATFLFLDLNAEAECSRNVSLTFRAENILGGASDFWPGYPEKPRSIWAAVKYLF